MRKRAPVSLSFQLGAVGLPQPVAEYRFHPTRRWRFDYAWPERKVACEVEGAVWVRGRHTRGAGFVKDLEKYNAATALGWRLVRVTPQQVQSGAALKVLEQVLG